MGVLKVELSGGTVLIDEEDFPIANNGKGWNVNNQRRAVRVWMGLHHKPNSMLLHRLIMKAKAGQTIDHINGNPLDNRKCNLRFCTPSQNGFNKPPERVGKKKIHSHGFKGIIRNNKKNLKKPWVALLQAGGKQFYSKYFSTPEEAAKAYDKLAKKHHGEFARLNFPEKK